MLRSMNELIGYRMSGLDGEIGEARDFLFDDSHWTVRYLVADTGNWLPGRKLIISPHWISRFDWEESKAHTDLTQSEIEKSPEYKASSPVNRDYEERLYDFYGRPVYWKRA